jgi:hypothetical protein
MQRRCKHAFSTIEKLCFLRGPCKVIIQKNFEAGTAQLTRVEAESNTSTVTLRIVGGDEKGSLKSECETVKYGHKSQGTRTRGLARASSIYKTQIRPLVREGAPHKQDLNCQRVINICS